MSIECMFCGEEDDRSHLEDVFPLWLCKKLAYYAQQARDDRETQPTYENYTYSKLADFQQDMTGGGPAAGSGELKGKLPSAYLLPDVCRLCNGGWMSRLEDAVSVQLPGFVEGKGKWLAPFDQTVLATWMVKTALTYDAARELRHVPAELGTRIVYERGLPLDDSYVWIGWDPKHVLQGDLAHGRYLMPKRPAAARLDANVLVVIFQFNAVLLKAILNFGADVAEHPEWMLSTPPVGPMWHLIWPVANRFEWPTASGHTVAGSS